MPREDPSRPIPHKTEEPGPAEDPDFNWGGIVDEDVIHAVDVAELWNDAAAAMFMSVVHKLHHSSNILSLSSLSENVSDVESLLNLYVGDLAVFYLLLQPKIMRVQMQIFPKPVREIIALVVDESVNSLMSRCTPMSLSKLLSPSACAAPAFVA